MLLISGCYCHLIQWYAYEGPPSNHKPSYPTFLHAYNTTQFVVPFRPVPQYETHFIVKKYSNIFKAEVLWLHVYPLIDVSPQTFHEHNNRFPIAKLKITKWKHFVLQDKYFLAEIVFVVNIFHFSNQLPVKVFILFGYLIMEKMS